MKDRKARNDRGSKGKRQGSVNWLPSVTNVATAGSGSSRRMTTSESGKTYSQDTGENPP